VSSTNQKNRSATATSQYALKPGVRPRRVLVGHMREGRWYLLAAEAVTPDGRKARVLEAREVEGDPRSALDELCEKHKIEAMVGVLGSGDAISRTVEVPEGHDEELGSAASLLAEAELPGSIPEHRKAGGVVPLPATAGFRSAILIGWPQRESDVQSEANWPSWTSEIVGLAELLHVAKGGGATGPRAVASVDRGRGCIGVVCIGPEHQIVRTALEDAAEPEAFEAAAERCVASACRKTGLERVPQPSRTGLWIDPEIRSAIATSVPGSRDDAAWFGYYGAVLGVACALLRVSHGSAAAFGLRTHARKIERNPVERITDGLKRPGTAAAVLVAGLAIAILVPVLLAELRVRIYESRLEEARSLLTVPGLNENADTQLTLQQQLAVYAELDRSRWPMTKLLADIAAAMPAEESDQLTLVRQINVSFGQAVTISGVADSAALVFRARQNLDASEIFRSSPVGRVTQAEGDDRLVDFDIVAEVTRPFFAGRALVDYSQSNLAERLYNEEGAEIWRPGAPLVTAVSRTGSPGARAARQGAGSSRAGNADTSGSASGRTGASGSAQGGSSSAVADAGDSSARTERREMFQGGSRSEGTQDERPIPEPLTDEAIAQLNQLEAMRESVARRSAARRDGVSDEVKRRLEEESTKLRARAEEARREGG